MKDIFLRSKPGHYNVFGVNWSNGSQTTFYNSAVANTRVVGALVGFFVERLLNITKAPPENVHLIGHSLGAHVVGYAGKRLKKSNRRIGRITALDPAGPSFQMENPEARIDREDANYVEALHTDAATNIVQGIKRNVYE